MAVGGGRRRAPAPERRAAVTSKPDDGEGDGGSRQAADAHGFARARLRYTASTNAVVVHGPVSDP